MFSLIMKTDLSNLPKVVETNIDDIAPIIAEKLDKVKGLVVDDAGLSAAKADAAEFRKMADRIGTFRKDHIKLWKDPMLAFETKCKDYEKRLTDAARELTDKCNEITDARKAEKRKQMWDLVKAGIDSKLPDASVRDMHDSPFWQRWFDEQTDPKTKGCWLNTTVPIETAYNEAVAVCERVLNDLEVIKANYGAKDQETKRKAYLTFCQSFDLATTLKAVADWEAERVALAAARAEDEKRKAKEAEAPAPAPAPVTPAKVEAKPDEVAKTWLVRVTGKCSQVKAVIQYAHSLGVEVEKADK